MRMKKIRLLFLTLAALLAGVSAQAADVTVYIDPVGDGTWLANNAKISVNVYTDGQANNTFVTPTTYSGNVLKVTFDSSFNRMIIVRGENQDAWGWNQTENITPVDNTLYKANGYTGTGNSVMAYTTVNPYIEEPAAGYTVDFNTEINTSSHDFAVAPKWKHIVQDNDGSYVNYKWDAAYGANETGGLLVYSQKVGTSSWDATNVYDLLVTPKVSGTIRLKVKAYENASSSTKAFVQLWSLNGTATEKDTQLKEFQTEIPGYSTGTGDWVELTYDVSGSQRIGIRAQYVYIDDFSADAIDTTPEAALVVSSVMDVNGNTGAQGTNPVFEQQPDENMKVVLKVTLSNTGDVDFVAGTTENYTLTAAQASYTSGDKTYYDAASIAIPENLAAGESKTFDVEFIVPYISGYKYWYVKENVTGTTSNSYRYATSVAYESKFVLREAGSTSTSDLTTAQDYGRVSSATTRSFEIYNDGTAPLTIKSITLPDGFTSDNLPEIPVDGLVLAKKEATAAFNVTLPVTTIGDFSGNLVIKYVKAGDAEESTKPLAFSGSVLAEGTWFADFNGDKNSSSSSAGVYPVGSVVTSSTTLQFGYTGSYGSYDHYLKSYSSAGMLVMPKLTATAGAQLKYDAVKYQSGNSYTLKVYVSTDRNSLGEAKTTINNSDLETSGERYTQTLTFDQAGDYYVAFELQGVGLDNVIGLTKAEVDHDVYFKKTSLVAEAQTGKEIKPSVEAIPLTDETAESYTVKYFVDGEAVATATSIALTASATSSKTFTISYTPTDEVTTEHDTYIAFVFSDGTVIATEHQTLKVTNEPKFLFVAASTSVGNYTTNLTTAQSFGKTNTTNEKNFKIYNQGTAPLTIKSIVAPEGFSVNKTNEFVVAAGENEDIIVTFSTETAGTYEGNLVVTYEQEGTKTYELAFSGTKLDPNKWYANFGSESDQWPAGSVYQDNVSTTYVNTGDYAITSSSDTKNIFVTPKLTATAGEKLQFNAKLYNSSWSEGKVVVYAAATREEVLNAEEGTTRTQLFSVSGQDETGAITTDYQTFEIPAVAGDNYYAFEISGRPYVDELYGLTQTAVEHDLALVTPSIPAEGMQNKSYSASVNVQNFGLADDEATVTAYVNGEAVATSAAVVIPMNHKFSDSGTQLSVSFVYPKAAENVPVYLEVKAGESIIGTTDPVEVTFAEEVAMGDAQVGTVSGRASSNAILDFYNLDGGAKTGDIVYTAAQLNTFGITTGSKIVSIAFKGYASSDKTISNSLTAWVGLKTGDITWNSPDKAAMTQVNIFEGSMPFVSGENLINVDLSSDPIVYDGTSDLRVYFEGTKGGWITLNFDYDNNYKNMHWGGNSTDKANPIAYITLEAQSATLTGTVTDGTNAVEGATVTLVSADGDNVQYTGTTDAEGSYSINVIQATREYNVTVTKEGLPDATATVAFGGENQTKDFYMVEPMVVTFVNGANWEKVNAYTYESEQSGTWPGTEISKTGTATIQGVEYDVYTYSLQTPTAPAKIIFNNGNSGDGNQTDNLDFADGEQYVYGITYYSVAGAFRADDASEDVAGIFGTAWATELNDLTKNDEGLYELSFTDVDLAKGTLKFKVVENHAWTTSYPSDNYTVYIAKPGTYSLTITFDANEKSVSHKLYYTLAENNEGIADMADVTVTVERQFKAGWNAVVLPFALTAEEVTEAFGEDSELAVYEGDKNENGAVTVMFKKISDNDKFFSAGYPYMLWLKESVSGLKFTKDISSTLTTAPGTTFDFVGVYEQTDNQDGDYIVQGGEFRKASTANYVLPFRAYLKLKDGQSTARSLNFVIGEGGTTTAINAAEIDGLNIEGVYNLNGQKVTNMNRKGLYIINGKKVMVK